MLVYSTTVSSVGGRDGTIRSDDGMLDLKVALPHSLGGTGVLQINNLKCAA
jgi:lipoyl-dependent peroxiredoxin